MTKLNFGRIGTGASGKFTLGKLECSGRTTLTSMPTSCYDLFIAGNQINGFYTVKGSSTQLISIYCDFTKTTGATGTLIVHFYKFVDDKLVLCLVSSIILIRNCVTAWKDVNII